MTSTVKLMIGLGVALGGCTTTITTSGVEYVPGQRYDPDTKQEAPANISSHTEDLQNRAQYIFVFRHATKLSCSKEDCPQDGKLDPRLCGEWFNRPNNDCGSPDVLTLQGIKEAHAINMFLTINVRNPVTRVVASACARTDETAYIVSGKKRKRINSIKGLRELNNNPKQQEELYKQVISLAEYLRQHPDENAIIVAHSTSTDALDDQLGTRLQAGAGMSAPASQIKVGNLTVSTLEYGAAWIVDASRSPPVIHRHLAPKEWEKYEDDVEEEVKGYCNSKKN